MFALEPHLKKWFGYDIFRPHQKEIVEGILGKKDVLAILPTGAGKSLCYQLPALLVDGTAIVISPLISLMQDQVAALVKSGISAAYVNSSLPLPALYEVLDNLNRYKLLYIAPERFADPQFLERLKGMPLSFFVIDEAHCISQWGHAFRPDYRQLSILKKTFPDKPMMALTATATPEVEKDIMDQLVMERPFIAKGSFDRPNLMIRMTRKSTPLEQISAFLKKYKDQSGIIYAATRKGVDSLYESLKGEGFTLGKYHAGMGDDDRSQALHDFIHDKTSLMVATVAFGMGINKPDIRFVIHHDMPKSIEQYYQEIGRAGRDGLPAECLMLYSAQDLIIYRHFLKDVADPALKEQGEAKTAAIYALCRSVKCRRIGLLKYFGENYPSHECTGCDNCEDEEEKMDGTLIAQKILSCVSRLNERFGVRHVVEVLRGSRSAQVLKHGHDTLSTYNLMSECSEGELRHYIETLLMMGFLKTSAGEYPVLQWTDLSRPLIKGEKKVEFRKTIFKEKKKETTALPYDAALFAQLKQLRLELARAEEIPPFAVFPDRTLYEFATYFPQNEEDLLAISGVGKFKMQAYGQRFLELIKTFSLAHAITCFSKPASVSSRPTKSPSKAAEDSAQESFNLFLQKEKPR